ncbi:hypothetical protein EK21DRAFT_92274 [Setomelanomma holmii]|uniref:Uncharacterized protein n=1 Tax=Setomelanomma holmii TaxID=210430 RepID=A0A9P4LIW8_9PLEO|nr:hypothetical protein EK21DRAFT_92274 [Setomelanomma holmii]
MSKALDRAYQNASDVRAFFEDSGFVVQWHDRVDMGRIAVVLPDPGSAVRAVKELDKALLFDGRVFVSRYKPTTENVGYHRALFWGWHTSPSPELQQILLRAPTDSTDEHLCADARG